MTPQEIFDTVATHLLKQGIQARLPDHPDDMCAYKAPGGLQCAAGCLIPAELYHHTMEELPINKVFVEYPSVANHIGIENLKLVDRLQALHDNDDPQHWDTYLGFVAEDFNLTPKVLTQ